MASASRHGRSRPTISSSQFEDSGKRALGVSPEPLVSRFVVGSSAPVAKSGLLPLGSPAKSAQGPSSPLSLRWRRCARCHNVLEEVDHRVLVLRPAVLGLLGQGAVVGGSRCVVCILA